MNSEQLAVSSLISLLEKSRDVINRRMTNIEFRLFDYPALIAESLRPLQERFRVLMTDVKHLEALLSEGASHASRRAQQTLEGVKERIGIAR